MLCFILLSFQRVYKPKKSIFWGLFIFINSFNKLLICNCNWFFYQFHSLRVVILTRIINHCKKCRDVTYFPCVEIRWNYDIFHGGLLLLLSGNISLNPGSFHSFQPLGYNELNFFRHGGQHFLYLNINN